MLQHFADLQSFPDLLVQGTTVKSAHTLSKAIYISCGVVRVCMTSFFNMT